MKKGSKQRGRAQDGSGCKTEKAEGLLSRSRKKLTLARSCKISDRKNKEEEERARTERSARRGVSGRCITDVSLWEGLWAYRPDTC